MRVIAVAPITRRGRSEGGQALPVVLAVVFVVVLISVALITRVDGDFANANLQTKIQEARALAQSGVSDALFQIDQLGSSPAAFCNQAGNAQCSFSGIPSAPNTVYTARYNPGTGAYTVLSQGTVQNISYAVQATIKQTPILLNAVTGSTVTFNGQTTVSIVPTDKYGNVIPNGKVGIGVVPKGSLTCNGTPDTYATYNNYGGSLSKCTPYTNWGPIYYPQPPSQTCPPPPNTYGAPPTPCMPNLTTDTPAGPTQSCFKLSSTAGAVTGSDAAGYTVAGPAMLEPGIYSCRGGLTMTGSVTVDYSKPNQNGGRVEIFVFPPVGQTLPVPNVTLAGATVNQCETTGTGSSGPCLGGLVGDPTDLQIYVAGGGTASLGSANVDAVLWAPQMTLWQHGAADALNWTGGLVLGTIKSDGSPVAFNLNFDQRLLTEYQETSWQISNYLQTNPGFAIP